MEQKELKIYKIKDKPLYFYFCNSRVHYRNYGQNVDSVTVRVIQNIKLPDGTILKEEEDWENIAGVNFSTYEEKYPVSKSCFYYYELVVSPNALFPLSIKAHKFSETAYDCGMAGLLSTKPSSFYIQIDKN